MTLQVLVHLNQQIKGKQFQTKQGKVNRLRKLYNHSKLQMNMSSHYAKRQND